MDKPGNTNHEFRYESSRHGQLMKEYQGLATEQDYILWGRKARGVAAYMGSAISIVSRIIDHEKTQLAQTRDKRLQQNIKLGLMQFESFSKVLQTQLSKLNQLISRLPNDPEGIREPEIPTAGTPYIKILVMKSGQLVVDGYETTLDNLRNALESLAQRGGVVLYRRESPQTPEPPAIAKQVIELIAANRLPVRLCQNIDFSDAVDENGKLRTG